MSLLTHGWAAEFRGRIAANCLWPRTTIDTAAIRNLLGGAEMAAMSRKPSILGDAAHAVLTKPSISLAGGCSTIWCSRPRA
jgi:citronellol/citronellal dehydrogenase